ncbi:antitoxin MazE [Brevundimonas sp. UYEF29]|uniref:AbrB/MazE/SpoVT family DNA-binding domain-containing protein n=1 Tax=Brevundimonas sp. UYEF29 TaxID=3156346 RepID=UPI003393D41C
MSSAIRKIGNSAGVILPKPVLESLGAKLGDRIDFVAENGRVFLSPAVADPREGWEEDSKRLGALVLSDEDREWLEAPLSIEAETDWEW